MWRMRFSRWVPNATNKQASIRTHAHNPPPTHTQSFCLVLLLKWFSELRYHVHRVPYSVLSLQRKQHVRPLFTFVYLGAIYGGEKETLAPLRIKLVTTVRHKYVGVSR
jgi:hypothetical protein